MDKTNNELKIALIGAGGLMGQRISAKLLENNYNTLLCEKGEEKKAGIIKKGQKAFNSEEGIQLADVTIMAVPDEDLEEISNTLVPLARPDSIIIALDAGAPHAGEFKLRNDCTFIVAHPCHPPLFMYQETPEAYADAFGGIAKQDIVIALFSGKEEKFDLARKICIDIFSPVVNCHRITVEQIAMLEPAATEVVAFSAIYIMREAMDEVIRLGVPEEAARAFMLGHINGILNFLFSKSTTTQVSEGAKISLAYGIEKIYKSDWKDVLKPESLKEVLQKILHPSKKGIVL